MTDQFTTTPNRHRAPWWEQPTDGPRLYWNPDYMASLDARSTESAVTTVPRVEIPKTEINPWRGDPAADGRKKCAECGLLFLPSHGNEVVCGPQCRRKREVKRVTANKARRRASQQREPRLCTECGKPFHHLNPQVQVCSEECRTKRERHRWQEAYKRKRQRLDAERGHAA